MNNLFILHTQYNLIIGSGIAAKCKEDFNVLVLYPEFKLTDIMLQKLNSIFDIVIPLRDNFEEAKYAWQEIKEIRTHLKKTKILNKYKFDRIFLSQERRFDTLLAYKFYKKNPCSIANIEEDAYYSLTVRRFGVSKRKSIKNKASELIRRIFCGKNPFYEYGCVCYGANKIYDTVYAVFPEVVRSEISCKKKIEVDSRMLLSGIKALYGDVSFDLPKADKYFVVFFDLVERFKNKDKALDLIRKIVLEKLSGGYKVLAKYHPRETEKFTDIEGVFEIDKLIPAEKLLSDLSGKNVIVLGNATTACWIGAKLGYEVYSIAKTDHPGNNIMHTAMEKMGIKFVQ